MIGEKPLCMACKRLHNNPEAVTCDAFPEGIPVAILVGGFNHREAHPGDNGLRFVPLTDGAATWVDEKYQPEAKRERALAQR
jgi:hypothetical protein